MDDCAFKKYLDKWHEKYKNDRRDCVYYVMLNQAERQFCKSIDCAYRPDKR